MQLGFIGLGKMGSRMVVKLLQEGHEVVVWNRSKEPIEELRIKNKELRKTNEGLIIAKDIHDLVKQLKTPRIVWSMLPAGDATEKILSEVSKYVEKHDIVVDGGNSNFHDTQRRFEMFHKKGIRFLGIGVSGGIIAATRGYPLMVGGELTAYDHILPILDSLSSPHGGHAYFGEGGAGHFVKMVHNAIEYGYMQSIGEGFGVLEKSPYQLDLEKVANLYTKGTLVSGFMMDRTVEVLHRDSKLEHITGTIGKASGETIWTVEQAHRQNLPVEIIERSLQIRNESGTDAKIQKSFAARMVSALRNAFGGHSVVKK